MIYFRNRLDDFLNVEWPAIKRRHLYVGVPRGDDFLTMVALVQEYGAHIQAKNYPFLWIPTSNAKGRKPSEIPNLYVRQAKGADHAAAGYDDQGSAYGFCVCFVLKKSVNIPARAFIRNCVHDDQFNWNVLIAKKLDQVMLGMVSVDDFFNIVGTRIANDLKDTIKEFSNPSNAALTIERKGRDDPLVDTGKLSDSITFELI